MKKDRLKVTAPATLANISCGFDMLGLCLEHTADIFYFTKNKTQMLSISSVEGFELSTSLDSNVAGVAGLALWQALVSKPDFGVEVEIQKIMRPGSGMGSSAASAAAMVYGLNELLGNPFSKQDLVYFAMQGEAFLSGQPHADNVAPALFGGITFISSYNPLVIKSLPVPNDFNLVMLFPNTMIKTAEARGILPKEVMRKDYVAQSTFLASFVSGLYENDFDLMAKGVQDVLVEPYRKSLIPHFEEYKQVALQNGGLSFGISGAGPSLFTLCKGNSAAVSVKEALQRYCSEQAIEAECFISKVNSYGTQHVYTS